MDRLIARLEASLLGRPAVPAGTDGTPARAAVAITFRADRGGPEFLLIRRAERAGDPWSGQVALPGGRWQVEDPSLEGTALRETLEETGLDIRSHGRVIGALDELRPRSPLLPPIVVTPFVAHLESVGPLVLSDEVASAFWVPWSQLLDPAIDRETEVTARGSTWRTPAFHLEGHVVWGMTERILRSLITRVHEIP
ncbi:MAG: CoA pyrophosphatase [Gemmatimonadetes bacterium]|nr:CoA pyrophosphatase [Gemmatimonadota bacterium]